MPQATRTGQDPVTRVYLWTIEGLDGTFCHPEPHRRDTPAPQGRVLAEIKGRLYSFSSA